MNTIHDYLHLSYLVLLCLTWHNVISIVLEMLYVQRYAQFSFDTSFSVPIYIILNVLLSLKHTQYSMTEQLWYTVKSLIVILDVGFGY